MMEHTSKRNNQEILYDLILRINNHEKNRFLSMVAENILIKSAGFGIWKGKTMVNKFLSELFISFPDFRMKPLMVCYSDDNPAIVMSEINIAGQQLGLFMGNPPSGKRFSINGVFVFEFDESMKVKMVRIYYDSKLIFRQLEILKV